MKIRKIHILDTEQKPELESKVAANCGKELIFTDSIAILFDDGRICEECLEVHRASVGAQKTFAFI